MSELFFESTYYLIYFPLHTLFCLSKLEQDALDYFVSNSSTNKVEDSLRWIRVCRTSKLNLQLTLSFYSTSLTGRVSMVPLSTSFVSILYAAARLTL
jgi:hypothetical protein